jgi:glycosyltransferase involved in cell wall biosynthesis
MRLRTNYRRKMKKIGIIGTRGIPNQYGGFEQFTQFFSEFLVQKGYTVVVYCSSSHNYKEKTWNGVNLVHINDPESTIGTAGQFIYDLHSILHARNQNFDVIFQLGYTSSSIWGFLFPKTAKLITNMDGLEWKRSKYNRMVQKFLQKAEKWAVKQSDILIADSVGIQNYLFKKYAIKAHFIPYGSAVISEKKPTFIDQYSLKPGEYHLLIARLEPENNIEMCIQGFESYTEKPLVVIGNCHTKYGKYLAKKYHGKVHFLGAIYDFETLNQLRLHCDLYFHGHSVGGTNPSLLEAMACSCAIVAHDNQFNRGVLAEDAVYFTSSEDVANYLINPISSEKKIQHIQHNLEKIETTYSFETIHSQLVTLFE